MSSQAGQTLQEWVVQSRVECPESRLSGEPEGQISGSAGGKSLTAINLG